MANEETSALERIFAAIEKERKRQDAKHGANNATNGPNEWISILAEEVGELASNAKDVHWCGAPWSHMRNEALQVAAVAVAIVEAIDAHMIPQEGFPPGYESLCQAAFAARGAFDGSTFQTVPPAGPPCTAEAVLAGAEALEAIEDLGPVTGRIEPPIFSGPVSDVALQGCIDLFRELVLRIDRSDSDSGWITKVGHWEWMASALEELRRRRRIDDEAELRRIEQIMANFPHPRPLPPPPASTNERLAALLKQISGDPDRAGPGLPDAKTATQQDEAEARQPSPAPSSGLLQALIGMPEQDADDPGSIAKVDTRAEAEVLSAMMQGGAIVLDVGFSGDWSAGLRAWQDTVLISCKSADFGGDPGEFAEAFRSFMAEWYDGAMVLVRGGPEQERIHEPDPPADDDGRTDSCSPETFN